MWRIGDSSNPLASRPPCPGAARAISWLSCGVRGSLQPSPERVERILGGLSAIGRGHFSPYRWQPPTSPQEAPGSSIGFAVRSWRGGVAGGGAGRDGARASRRRRRGCPVVGPEYDSYDGSPGSLPTTVTARVARAGLGWKLPGPVLLVAACHRLDCFLEMPRSERVGGPPTWSRDVTKSLRLPWADSISASISPPCRMARRSSSSPTRWPLSTSKPGALENGEANPGLQRGWGACCWNVWLGVGRPNDGFEAGTVLPIGNNLSMISANCPEALTSILRAACLRRPITPATS